MTVPCLLLTDCMHDNGGPRPRIEIVDFRTYGADGPSRWREDHDEGQGYAAFRDTHECTPFCAALIAAFAAIQAEKEAEEARKEAELQRALAEEMAEANEVEFLVS